MKPSSFGYCRPETVEEALAALERGGPDAKLLAGGQSLVPVLNLRLAAPSVLIDLNRVAGLDSIHVDNSLMRIGAVFPYMREQRSGSIINVASNTVWKGVPGFLHYVSSKAALLGLSRSLAREVGDYNIAVYTVAPDFIPDEGLLQEGGHNDEVVAQRCFKRSQLPEDMVGIITFLAGPGAQFITGQSFLVNGGAHFQ